MMNAKSAPAIIASKLHPPLLSSRYVPRQRLIDWMNEGSDRPLTLVCAPAGAGKSSLVSEWAASIASPIGWISLDAGDNEIDTFLRYALAAVRSLFPTLPLRSEDLLRSLDTPPVETLAVTFSNDLAQIGADFTLVLDDYHVITNPLIDEMLLLLLRHPPSGMHLVVASRANPPWPLATLRARGHLAELRFADLRFTAEESAALIRHALGDALSEDFVAVMHEETEGWAAGMQLMTLVARHEDGQARILGERGVSKDLAAFLLDEVFARQSPRIQTRLLQMSILGRFRGSLLEAVCDGGEEPEESGAWGKAFLTSLEQLNLFTIALDDSNEYFRFHHLFQRFLTERLHERCDPARIAALHRQASAWFAAHGLIEEALAHALAAGDTAIAADLVASHRHDLYNKEQFSRLTRWLRLLPVTAKEGHPELLLAEARVATLNWRFTEAAVLLDHAKRELERAPRQTERVEAAWGELAALQGMIDLWAGNAEQLLAGAQRALALLPPDAGHLRGMAHTGHAAAYWLRGERDQAWSYLEEQLASTSLQLPVFTVLLQTQSFLRWLDGDLTNLLVSAKRLLAVSQDLDLPEQQALAHYFIGTVLYARNDLAGAQRELLAAVTARFTLRLMWWTQAAGLLALTEQALGRHMAASETLRDAQDLVIERHAVRILPNVGAFQARLDVFQGRLAEAGAWAAQVEPGPLTWAHTALEPRVARAQVYLAQEGASSIAAAAALIAELRGFCERVPNPRLFMEVELLAALLDDRRGDHAAALERVQRVVLEAEPEGWVRPFADLGEPMERLLRKLAAARVLPQAVARILDAFPTRGQGRIVNQRGLVEPLSERELEVLAFLGARDSNKEVAARLFITPSTVRQHTLNIYRKLEVNDRRAAVARACELGLLSPMHGSESGGD